MRDRGRLADRLRRPLGAMGILLVMAILPGTIPARAAAQPTEVNTCGQVFSGNGFLSGDLDCSAFTTPGFMSVKILGGTLDLRGFTLTSAVIAVECTKSCRVVSDPPGGTIASGGSGTITAVAGIKLRVSDVVINNGILSASLGKIKILDSTITGIVTTPNGAITADKVTLIRSVVTGNSVPGIRGRAKIIDSEVSNNTGVGIDGRATVKRSMIFGNSEDGIGLTNRVRVTDSSITGNGRAGIVLSASSKAKILRSNISGNAKQGIAKSAFPVQSGRVVVREVTITNNGAQGILLDSGTVKLRDSTVTGNALDGVSQINTFAGAPCKLILQGTTTVAGNGTDPSCGVSRTCADLTSCDPPEVDPTSTCNTSYDVNSGFPGVSWGVCALD